MLNIFWTTIFWWDPSLFWPVGWRLRFKQGKIQTKKWLIVKQFPTRFCTQVKHANKTSAIVVVHVPHTNSMNLLLPHLRLVLAKRVGKSDDMYEGWGEVSHLQVLPRFVPIRLKRPISLPSHFQTSTCYNRTTSKKFPQLFFFRQSLMKLWFLGLSKARHPPKRCVWLTGGHTLALR